MGDRDAAEYHEASHWPDVAEGCDSLEDHVMELLCAEMPQHRGSEKLAQLAALVTKIVRAVMQQGMAGAAVDLKKLQGRELMARLIAEIIDAPHARLMARCIDLTFSLGVQLGLNETQIASLEGLTKATASHYCVTLKDTYLEGRPAPGMKSNAAVESYRRVRTGKSSRGPRTEWAFAATFMTAYGTN